MSEKSGIYNVNQYQDTELALMHSILAGSIGYVVGLGNELEVTNTSGLQIQIDTGGVWLGNPAGWWYHNDAPIIMQHDAESAGQNRIDRIIIRSDRNTSAVKSEIVILKGTAAGSPVAPNLTQNETIYELSLAQVLITGDSTTIVITNERGSIYCPTIYRNNNVIYNPVMAVGVVAGKCVLFDNVTEKWIVADNGIGIFDGANIVRGGICKISGLTAGFTHYNQIGGSVDVGITSYPVGNALSDNLLLVNITNGGRPLEYTVDLDYIYAMRDASGKAKIKLKIDEDSDGAMLRRKSGAAWETGDDETTGTLVANITDDTNYSSAKWYHDSGLTDDTEYYYKAFPYKNGIYNNIIGVNEFKAIAGGLKAEYINDPETINGSIMEDQSNSYDATNSNVTYQDAGGTYDGDEGVYNGSSSKTALPGTLMTLSELNQDWSFSCVMNADALARMALISFSENADFRFTLESGGNLQINKPSSLSTSGFTAEIGTKYHVVLVRNKAVGFAIYVNGVLKGSNSETGNLVSYGYPPSYIGAHKQFDQLYEWDGTLNLSRLFNIALTAEEVAVMYNDGDFI